MKFYTENMQVNIPLSLSKEPVSVSKLNELSQSASVEINQSANSQTDQVNISEEGRQKSIDDENQAAMRKMAGNEDVNSAQADGEQTLDEKIAELREEITKLTADITQERTNGNDEKAKTMEAELVMLNAQLLQLIEQQMEGA
ncbi:hypothetical protein WNY51_03540 [Pseudocolwellia sp. AS88]|uniref:hypothetical protein n=1 Tax=Pseudocolwellia sp. AS88 TaxID=3063958 RepID=UPI0026F02A6E|nr:hypothetical protein [Pseudocolwellia sp. AS88]MDO7084883.1 hypothetical protein [Pseudocolwellia sp. AS88]